MLGTAACEVLGQEHRVRSLGRHEVDITDFEILMQKLIQEPRPDLIVHCAAFTKVDEAESPENRNLLWKTNVDTIRALCGICLKHRIRIMYPQTFLVLKDQLEPHGESSLDVGPLGLYAWSKLEAEKVLCDLLPPELRMVIRLGGLFGGGPGKDKNFVGLFLRRILPESQRRGEKIIEVGDRVWQPTWTKDIAHVMRWALERPWCPSYQYASSEGVSFASIAAAILTEVGLSNIEIVEVPSSKIVSKAPRPQTILMTSSDEVVRAGLVQSYRPRLRAYLEKEWGVYCRQTFFAGVLHHE